MEHIIIVGGVAAGATAAAKARRISQSAQITILEAGPDVSFANCGLPYYIANDIDARSKLILQSPESFKSQYNVNVLTNTEAVEIDPANKSVTVVDKNKAETKKLNYTKLILAQGSNPVIPPLDGATLPHVFKLWTLKDMDAIDKYIDKNKPKTAAVIGGGFIGLEMVEALAKRGLKIQLVEAMPHILANMDPEIAAVIEHEMLTYCVTVHKNKKLTKITPQSVILDDDSQIPADLVLLSIGVRPDISLAKSAGLKIGETGALHVDEN